MTDPVTKLTVQHAGKTLSRVLWDAHHEPTPGLIGQVYGLNPGLSRLGTLLPVGTEILIPTPEPAAAPRPQKQVTLWE